MLFSQVSSESPFSAYYRLGVADEGATIVIDVPIAMWDIALKRFKTHEYRTKLKEWLHLRQEFILPSPLPWGFCPAFMNEASPIAHWHRIRYELPHFDSGSQDHWKRSMESIASLWFLVTLLWDIHSTNSKEAKEKDPPYQLIEFDVSISTERGIGYAISAGLSDTCCNWIVRNERSIHVDTISAYMQRAYCRMQGLQKLSEHEKRDCNAIIRQQCSLSFHAPGDRTFLATATNHRQRYGIELYDHNVDNPTQLLTLLVGLATLSDLVSQDL